MADEVQVAEASEVSDVVAQQAAPLDLPQRATGRIADLANPRMSGAVYFSLKLPREDDWQGRLQWTQQAMRAQGAVDYKVGKVINEPIHLVNVFAHRVFLRNVDKETGEVSYVPAERCVLFDKDGHTYEAVSDGMLASLATLFYGLGDPSTWRGPVPVVVRQVDVSENRRTYKLELLLEGTPKKR